MQTKYILFNIKYICIYQYYFDKRLFILTQGELGRGEVIVKYENYAFVSTFSTVYLLKGDYIKECNDDIKRRNELKFKKLTIKLYSTS